MAIDPIGPVREGIGVTWTLNHPAVAQIGVKRSGIAGSGDPKSTRDNASTIVHRVHEPCGPKLTNIGIANCLTSVFARFDDDWQKNREQNRNDGENYKQFHQREGDVGTVSLHTTPLGPEPQTCNKNLSD